MNKEQGMTAIHRATNTVYQDAKIAVMRARETIDPRGKRVEDEALGMDAWRKPTLR